MVDPFGCAVPLSKQIIGGLYIFTLIVMVVSGWTVPQRPVVHDLVLVFLSDVLLIVSAPLFWKNDFSFAAVFMCVAFAILVGDSWQATGLFILDGVLFLIEAITGRPGQTRSACLHGSRFVDCKRALSLIACLHTSPASRFCTGGRLRFTVDLH